MDNQIFSATMLGNVVLQLRVWAIELADEADTVERRTLSPRSASHVRRRSKPGFGKPLLRGKER